MTLRLPICSLGRGREAGRNLDLVFLLRSTVQVPEAPAPILSTSVGVLCSITSATALGPPLLIPVMGGVGPREMESLYKGDNGKSPICGQVPFTGSLKGQGGGGQGEWGRGDEDSFHGPIESLWTGQR